jgi:hypothetical protein
MGTRKKEILQIVEAVRVKMQVPEGRTTEEGLFEALAIKGAGY